MPDDSAACTNARSERHRVTRCAAKTYAAPLHREEAGAGEDAGLPALSSEAQHRAAIWMLCCRLGFGTRCADLLDAEQLVGRDPEAGVLRRPLVDDPPALQDFAAGSPAEREPVQVGAGCGEVGL